VRLRLRACGGRGTAAARALLLLLPVLVLMMILVVVFVVVLVVVRTHPLLLLLEQQTGVCSREAVPGRSSFEADGRGGAGAEARAVDDAHARCGRQLAERRPRVGRGVSILVVVVGRRQ
jgi:hypothetical protein